jgi:predicted adenylyl cyclase CyaB
MQVCYDLLSIIIINMANEIEVKFLDVDKGSLEVKLGEMGAVHIGEVLFRSISFDYPGFPLDKKASWIRLRDEGAQVTLAYKQRLGIKDDGSVGTDEGMEEVEFKVSDYSIAREFLLKIGLIEKFSQEKIRSMWRKDDVHFDIDIWPKLKPYLEIEAPSMEMIDSAIKDLGFDPKEKKICSTTEIYSLVGINDKDYIKMTFDEFIKRH